MSRTSTITVSAAIAGFVIALVCCALAAWNFSGADSAVRVLMPMSGGVKHLSPITSRLSFVTVFCWINAAIYGAVGFVIGILLQIFRPTMERPLD